MRAVLVTRRDVLRWGVAGGAVALLPTGLWRIHAARAAGAVTPAGTFLTAEEKAVLIAVTGRIVPTDERPGAIEAGAAEYIDAMLSFVPSGDANCDGVVSAADLAAVSAQQGPASAAACAGADVDGNGAVDATDAVLVQGALFDPSAQLQAAPVFAGGPFSDRNPFPDPATGTPSTRYPENDFATFLPLTRLQLMSWRVQLLGTAAVPGSDFNVDTVGPVVGLRDRYRAGLAAIEAQSQTMFASAFAALTPEQQDAVLGASDSDFLTLVTNHTLEGMFCAPEYGGNKNLAGWMLIGYDGDSQPLGYSIFDATTMTYNERPDKPNSTANPDEDFSGVDAATQAFLRVLVRVVGGPHFPTS